MPIIHPQILNAIYEYHLAGQVLCEKQLESAIHFSNELTIFLQILS